MHDDTRKEPDGCPHHHFFDLRKIDFIRLGQTRVILCFVLVHCQIPARFAWPELHSGLPAGWL